MFTVSTIVIVACILAITAIAVLYVRLIRPLPLEYPNRRGKVQCQCGKVTFILRNFEARFSLDCCCMDCRKRKEWVRMRGYNTPKYVAPVAGVWMHNAITEVHGEEHLKPWKLNASTATRWLLAECCGSQMGVVHPAHLGSIAVFLAERVVESTKLETGCRLFPEQWDAEANGPVPAYDGPGIEVNGRSTALFVWRFFFSVGLFWVALRRPQREPGDITLQDLIDRNGPIQIVDQFPLEPQSVGEGPRP